MNAPTVSPRADVLPWLVAMGFFMQTRDGAIVNSALPSMARSLSVSPLRMRSVVVAHALTMTMRIPASGWLVDRFGTRRGFIAALFPFFLGPLLCAISPTLGALADPDDCTYPACFGATCPYLPVMANGAFHGQGIPE
jgi:MFS family permease